MTSLPFANTLSASTEAATHADQVTSTRGMRFQIKRDRESREREMHPLMVRRAWCGFGMVSEGVQCGPLPPQRPLGQQELTQIDKEEERDEERKSDRLR